MLERYTTTTAAQRRVDILTRLGVDLKGAPSKAWLPVLTKAAGNFDPAISRNALQVIEDLTGEYDCLALDELAPGARGQALSAFFQDHGIVAGAD